MKQRQITSHPLLTDADRIGAEGIVVFNNVSSLPTVDRPFVSPDYVICIGQSGSMNLLFDGYRDTIQACTVAVVFPNHALTMVDKTEDYRATLIVVSASAMNEPMLQIINHFRYRYERQPRVTLNEHDCDVLMHLAEVMRETSLIDIPQRRTMIVRQMECLLRFLNYYRKKMLDDERVTERISVLFEAAINEHFRKHRNVAFYANLACLTPKYFSTVIHHQTGQTAAFWINARVIAEAKILLHTRHDISVKAVADLLGFSDQNSFSRYFKRETGVSPTEFRELE